MISGLTDLYEECLSIQKVRGTGNIERGLDIVVQILPMLGYITCITYNCIQFVIKFPKPETHEYISTSVSSADRSVHLSIDTHRYCLSHEINN